MIPISEVDDSWRALMQDLHALRPESEILIVSTERKLSQIQSDPLLKGQPVLFVPSSLGRARQLNAGAAAAKNEYLWFLHCDSRFSQESLEALHCSIGSSPNALHFFDLRFHPDGPIGMKLTEAGTWIRSRIFRIPFGDQGFCISREEFSNLGGFNEHAPYGEDHLLVWKAHQTGIELKAIGHALFTSARKYQSNGWGATTARHLRLTTKQALPELMRFLRTRKFL